jgi:predicted acylesterase/phospholipase RssA
VRAIAFEGCACRAAFHAGVAAGLAEAGQVFPLSAGASSGSLIAAGVAAGRSRDLPSVWQRLAGRSVLSLRRVWKNRSIFDMSTLVRSTLRDELGAADLRRAPGEALVTATRLRDLSSLVYSSREEADLIEPLLGSCFFPVLYGRTVRVRGDLLVDGGLRDNLPLEALAARGATEIVAVVTSPDGTALKHPLNTRWRPSANGVPVRVIHPQQPLEVKSWDFDPGRVARAIDAGRAAAQAFLATE